MRTRKLKPGQKGTKRFTDTYGDALFCVRYRYDEERRTRTTTVEIIVDKGEWTPQTPSFSPGDLVPVTIGFAESHLQERAKSAGGRWDPQLKLWFIRYDRLKGAELEDRIVAGVPAKRPT